MIYPKISIVTTNLNLGKYLDETINSVVGQGYPNLEYIIIDGGSTDNSVDIIKRNGPHINHWVSERDGGMYHALNKGFRVATGDIMGWLNSDDILHPKSLFTVAQIFCDFEKIEWLQGYPSVIDEDGRLVYHRVPRSSKYAFYLKDYHDGGFIQQESTFWRRSLWEKSGKYISERFRYAGDFELWMRFFDFEVLHTTTAILGAFRVRRGQQSIVNFQKYLQDCDCIIENKILTLSKADQKVLSRIRTIRRLKKYCREIEELPYVKAFLKAYLAEKTSIAFDFSSQRFINSAEA